MASLAYGEALQIIGGLSKPGKMPWWSWSIPASECITGSKLRQVEGSTCASCYALKGNYVFPNVRQAQRRRQTCADDPRFVDAFVTVLTELHRRVRRTRIKDGVEIKENRFRWFDAGDLQSLEMLEKINEIAARTPMLEHWLPTRELKIVRAFLERNEGFSSNLIVRPSTPMVGQAFTRPPFGLPFSTVGRDEDDDVEQCKAPLQENECRDCDACWRPVPVNYHLH